MNGTTLEAAPRAQHSDLRGTAAPVQAPIRRPRRVGPGTAPAARPRRPLGLAGAGRTQAGRAQSCSVAAPTVLLAPQPVRTGHWRLTERGIALVLVTGLLIVTASLAVVGLTALRVTSDVYHPAGQSVLVQP